MREFKMPDLKAPRFRPQVHNILNKKFFDSFRKKYPKYKEMKDSELRKIIKYFNNQVYQTAIDNRDGIQLPESIGWIFIGTCQQSKKENIDYSKSNKYGMTVTNKNWETDGKLAKIFYTNFALKHKMKNREYWGFVACREFKRAVSKSYPENWPTYIVVDPTQKIKLNYQKAHYKDLFKKREQEALKDYNEFDL
jgi:hypothetical protein